MKKLDAKDLGSVAGGCCQPAGSGLPAAGPDLLQRQVPDLLRSRIC